MLRIQREPVALDQDEHRVVLVGNVLGIDGGADGSTGNHAGSLAPRHQPGRAHHHRQSRNSEQVTCHDLRPPGVR